MNRLTIEEWDQLHKLMIKLYNYINTMNNHDNIVDDNNNTLRLSLSIISDTSLEVSTIDKKGLLHNWSNIVI